MGTLAEQLQMLERQGISRPTSLNGMELVNPPELNTFETWILKHWEEIDRSRRVTDNGLLPITDHDIQCYMSLMEEDLRLMDIKLIKAIDKQFIGELAVQKDLNSEN